MGRTNPTFRAYLERFGEEWQPYRRALRREHQPAFDALLTEAERFAAAGGNQNPTEPERAILLSMLLAHQCKLEALEAALEDGVEPTAADGHGGTVGRE